MSEICRICLSSNSLNDLISPCNCKGSQQYVHESCLDNWLETVMDNVLTSPSGKNAGNIFRCNVCNSRYTHVKKKSFKIFLSPQLKYYWEQYTYYIYAALIILMVSYYFINWLLMTVILLILSLGISYYTSMRPHIFNTDKGYRISLIRIGYPVNELRSGILLEATNQISRGIFARTMVLITEYNRQKAIGFIINKGMSKFLFRFERS